MSVTIALDLGGTSIKLALVTKGSLLCLDEIPVEQNSQLQPFLPIIEKKVSAMSRNQEIDLNNISGLGMAFPSIVDNQQGIILSDYVKYQDVNLLNLKQWAQHIWGVPLIMENDARAALVGEWQYGAGQGKNDIVQVTIGTGMGTAVLMDGKLIRGKHYLAGNLGGHTTIKYDGELCNCGNIGCLESVASTWALPAQVKSHPQFQNSQLKHEANIDYEAVFRLAAKNDVLSIEARDAAVTAWGFGVINLVHSFDPELIILSGGVMDSKDHILPRLKTMVDQHTWPPPGTYAITAAQNQQHAALLGLSYLANNDAT